MPITKTLRDLARVAEGELKGDPAVKIKGVASLLEAKTGDITFLTDPKDAASLEKTKATAAVVPRGVAIKHLPVILSERPALAFARIVGCFLEIERPLPGIHPSAVVEKDAKVGKNGAISALCYIGRRSVLEEGVVLYPQVTVGPDCVIGEGTILYPGVVIRDKTIVGKRVILHSGVVIGSDGFGYLWDGKQHYKVPQAGRVIIEDDVELGANTTVDRATLGTTVIGRGTKLDNLVHIGHNSKIGANTVIAAQTGLSGSVDVADGVVMGGQAGIADHVKVGKGARIGAQAGVIKDVAPGETVSGYPARPHRQAMRILAYLERLPELFDEVKELRKRAGVPSPKTKRK